MAASEPQTSATTGAAGQAGPSHPIILPTLSFTDTGVHDETTTTSEEARKEARTNMRVSVMLRSDTEKSGLGELASTNQERPTWAIDEAESFQRMMVNTSQIKGPKPMPPDSTQDHSATKDMKVADASADGTSK
ncbi:hypothetical protein LTS10_004328 [Elasticomyces elasticus]|nr:hypothetical protein LTS10_004328 [Elasticomyces elasticus]